MAQSIKLIQGPSPVETSILHFKLLCKVKVFDTKIKYATGHCCVVAASQHYGLIFVGTTTGFLIIKADSLDSSSTPDKYLCKNVHLNLRPAFLSVDSTQKILAVTCNSKAGAVMLVFNIPVLLSKKVPAMKFHAVSQLAKNDTAEVVDVVWQPNTDGGMAVCMTDGSVLCFSQPTSNEPPFILPSSTQATCLCWSPKGKQIVIGSAEGTLSQYKPDLKIVKTLPRPPLYFENTTVLSVLWISNYQFLAAYTNRDDPNFFPVFTIYNAVKNEPITVINFEDVTYTTNLYRIHQPYMIHQVAWNMIFVTSSNSLEVAVLYSSDGTSWEQWLMGDASRAELPLNANREETFPLGWAIDYTSAKSIPWGEGSLPPMPRLFILTDEGLLCVFNVVNTTPNIPMLCAPPKEPVDESLFSKFSPLSESEAVSIDTQKNENSKPVFGSATTFGALCGQTVGVNASAPLVGVSPQATPVLENKEALVLSQPQQQPLLPAQTSQFKAQQPFTLNTQFGAVPSPTPSTTSVFLTKPAAPPETTTVTKPSTTQSNLSGFKPATSRSGSFFPKTDLQSTPVKPPEPAPKEAPKVEEATTKITKEGENSGPGIPELAAVDDTVYLKALQEEIEHFDSELRQLKAKVGSLNIQLGTEEDKLKMRKSIEGFSEFWKELKDTTEGQSNEIHSVVLDLMEAFAWLENAKSRNLQRKNPSYIELKKSEELDPLSARYMSEISHLKYYIENQLKQLSNYLDKEWMDHQENYRNQIKKEMAVPALEEVYKTMHLQLKILHKQRMLVEELKEKVSSRKRKNKSPMSITSDSLISSTPNRYSELSKLAQNLLQLKIEQVEHPKQETSEVLKSHLQSVTERSKKLSSEKQAALRDVLSERDTVKIRPVKTTFETSSFLRSLASQKIVQSKKSEPKPAFSSPVITETAKTEAKPQYQSVPELPSRLQPQPQPHFQFQPSPQSQRQPLFQPQLQSQPQLQVQSPLQTQLQSQPQLQVQSPLQTQLQSQPQLKAQSPLQSQLQSQTQLKAQSPLQSQLQSQPQLQVQSPLQSQLQSQPQPQIQVSPQTQTQSKSQSQIEKTDNDSVSQPETTKNIFVFGSAKPVENPIIPITVQALPKTEEKSPLASLSGIVSNIGKKAEPAFVFGSQKPEQKSEKPEEVKAFTFGAVKLSEPVFGKKEPTVFGAKPSFNFGTPKTATIKPEVSITPISTTTTVVTATTSGFTFSSATVTTTATNLPKMNIIFGKEQTTVTTTATIFGGTKTTNLFDSPKTTEAPAQVAFSLTKSSDNKISQDTGAVVTSVIKQTEEVEVVNVEDVEDVEETKKPETPKEVTAVSASTVTTASESPKPSVVAPTPPITVTTSATPTPVTTAVTSTTDSQSTVTVSTTSSALPFSTTSGLIFGQAATTTNIFGQPASTASIFGQVTSTPTTSIFSSPVAAAAAATTSTVTAAATVITSTFGSSAFSKPTFGQAPTFGVSTPITTSTALGTTTTPLTTAFESTTSSNIFGTSTTTPTLGQKSDPVSQTTGIFSQLLSDNRSVFGANTTAATTTTNIFSTPKNIFGGTAGTTTASLFSTPTTTTTSIFPQTTSVFGQPTTTANVFGQPSTPTSSPFFNQNVCSPFGGNRQQTTPTSNQTFESGGFNKPIFGSTTFGQSAGNTSIFGGSPVSSIFGGGSSTTSGNLFQTPTTSSTFGSTSPGPFSSGGGSVAETGFGAATSTFQNTVGGFGSPPVFQVGPSPPAFGGSPTFGGSASFGSLPSFGSFSQSGFGQSSGSATFGNLANQNTLGFGNLAQQSQGQGFGSGGGFGSSGFENKPAFGGNSFSSWRSS